MTGLIITSVFENSTNPGGSEASLGTSSDLENFKFEREDWTSFRTIDGLQRKAGVTSGRLQALVMKELCDNALDTGASVEVGQIDDCVFFVEDSGPGIGGSPDSIADLFSIRRHLVSSKLLRLPTRGALGNGLRVVAGLVLASEGSLCVTTRNQRIVLQPRLDGRTEVLEAETVDYPVGTRIEIGFGPLPYDDVLEWAQEACRLGNMGETYGGKTWPYWYDAPAFHELILASGHRPVRDLLAKLDGCSGPKAGVIVSRAELGRILCSDVERRQAATLLTIAREHAREVKPERLGAIGPSAFPSHHHASFSAAVDLSRSNPPVKVPFVVEAWARRTGAASYIRLRTFVNRTPVIQTVKAYREKTDLEFYGCGLHHKIGGIPTSGAFDIQLNILTPYCPITSDGKAPDLAPFANHIVEAVKKAVVRAHRDSPKESAKASIKDVVLANLDAAVAKASGDGAYDFNSRQIFYALREVVQQKAGKELREGTFQGIITDYENEHGEIAGMFREPRGSLLHPHSAEGFMALGTLSVRDYERPAWTFSSILYIEKEGFSQALQAARWPERHDCALMSSKGFTTRAARDLIDKLAEHDEPVTVFCCHDADAFGTLIYETFQNETKARGARKVKIINMGLEPEEALDMGLVAESGLTGDRNKPVADYVPDEWREWLQTNRVELNAMTMPQFIEWLDGKMEEHGARKLIPPQPVIEDFLNYELRRLVRDAVRERILREAGFNDQVETLISAIKGQPGFDLVDGIHQMFGDAQERSWRDHIEAVASTMTQHIGGGL